MNPIQKALAQAERIVEANAELERLSRPAPADREISPGTRALALRLAANERALAQAV